MSLKLDRPPYEVKDFEGGSYQHQPEWVGYGSILIRTSYLKPEWPREFDFKGYPVTIFVDKELDLRILRGEVKRGTNKRVNK